MEEFSTLLDVLERSTERHATRPALGTKRDGRWEYITYAELRERMARARGGLRNLGVKRGDRVAIISDNREEWAVIAGASYGLSAQVVPMYQNQLASEWEYILKDSGAKIVFTATAKIAETIQERRARLPSLEHVVCFESPPPGVLSYAELLNADPGPTDPPAPDDIAGFVYTSGTTGKPKGVLLSHANIVSNINGVHRVFTFEPDDRSLSILPWAHSFGQVGELYMLLSMGCSIAVNDALPNLLTNLQEVQPTVLFLVPRVLNKLHEGVRRQMEERPQVIQRLFEDGLHFAVERDHGHELGLMQRAELSLSNKLIFSKVRKRFGGRLKYAISASAALNPAVAEFVQAMGITVYEGYGLSETSPIVSVNYPGHHKPGSVGRPIPGVRVHIDKSRTGEGRDGEIVVYGPNVMRGYHGLPEETQKALTEDGGLRTGDLGYLDEDGYLYITGRIKEQYKLENGKYVMPARLEEQLRLSPLINNVVVYGANRPYNVALVVVNQELLRERLAEKNLPVEGDLLESPSARELVQRELDALGSEFRSFERPRKCALIAEDFTCENGLLTPTLKLKRDAVVKRYQEKLEALYAEAERPPASASRPSTAGDSGPTLHHHRT